MSRRVVITGIGVVAPNGHNVDTFKEALLQMRSGLQHVEKMATNGFACCVAGISEYPEHELPQAYLDHRIHTASDFVRLAVLAGLEAWESADLPIPEDDNEVDWDTGIIIGTSTPGADFLGEKVVPLTDAGNVRRIGGYGSINTMGSAPSAYLSGILGTGNVSVGNSSACCSGTDAIVESYHRIKSGRATRMLAGGSEGFAHYHWASLDAMRALNRSMNDRPTEACRPMSESAAGIIPASAAGVLVLEELETAKARGANILAEVLGGESNSGGQRNGGTITLPNGEGVVRCLESTIAQAGIALDEIDLISGHLTAAKSDPLEIQNWKTVFGATPFPKINSIKGLTGHALGAAGGIESVACVLQLQHDFIHGTANCEDLHPTIASLIDTSCIPQQTIENAGVHTIIKANFGFGDVNSAVIFRKMSAES